MPPAPPGIAPKRLARVALLLAWLILLAGLATAGGYVLMLPDEHDRAAVTAAFGPPEEAEDSQPDTETTAAGEATADTTEQIADTESHGAEPPAVAEAVGEPEKPPEAAASQAEPAGAPPQWQRYRQVFDETDKRPRIAIVLTGMGLSSAATEAAINRLPAAVTLSFTPYSRRLDQWVTLARSSGHEVMLDLPMEPTSYPDDDPGPQGLLTALSPEQNLDRLKWTLGRVSGYVGVATVMGSRFTTAEDSLTPVLEALKEQGLIFLDNRSSQESIAWRLAAKIGIANALNDRTLDTAQASRVAIDARLVQLEGVALAEGFAVAMGRPYPVTIERVREWAKGLSQRGFVLAPISAVVDRQGYHRGVTQSTQAK